MTDSKSPAPAPAKPVKRQRPTQGGSYVRDPKTGRLTRAGDAISAKRAATQQKKEA